MSVAEHEMPCFLCLTYKMHHFNVSVHGTTCTLIQLISWIYNGKGRKMTLAHTIMRQRCINSLVVIPSLLHCLLLRLVGGQTTDMSFHQLDTQVSKLVFDHCFWGSSSHAGLVLSWGGEEASDLMRFIRYFFSGLLNRSIGMIAARF